MKTSLNTTTCIIALFFVYDVGSAQIYQEGQRKIISQSTELRTLTPGLFWSTSISEPGTNYIRLHFNNIKDASKTDYAIHIKSKGKDVAIYPKHRFSKKTNFYSDVIFSDRIVVEVRGEVLPKGLSFKIYEYIHKSRKEKQAIGVPNWWDFGSEVKSRYPTIYTLGQAVAKLYVGYGIVCSGFLFAPQYLMTAYHCLKYSLSYKFSKPDCDDIRVHFDYEGLVEPQSYKCMAVMSHDQNTFDYAVLKILNDDGQPPGNLTPLKFTDREVSKQEDVFIVHHPQGLFRKLSTGCRILDVKDTELGHNCYTLEGSSGSPVLDNNNRVVGLHVSGPWDPQSTSKEISQGIAEKERKKEGTFYRATTSQALLSKIRDLLP